MVRFPPLTVGLLGFGAFGQLTARHLAPHARLHVHDPAWPAPGPDLPVLRSSLAEVGGCPVVVLAVPVAQTAAAATALAPHLVPGTLVLDVGSIKTGPAAVLARALPPHVDIVATHPLFGPQSTRDGLAGRTIVLCPVRGRRTGAVTRFLRERLGLRVVITTPDEHDRELATVQGLTHLVGRLLAAMGPLPARLTTRSFDLLVEAAAMVVGDAPGVFDAILRDNPHAAAVRQRFFAAAATLDAELASPRNHAPAETLTPPSPRAAMLPPWSSAPDSAPSWCP